MEQSVSNSIFIPSGKGTKALNGAESTSRPHLITRRSKVQILPPQPEKEARKHCFLASFLRFLGDLCLFL